MSNHNQEARAKLHLRVQEAKNQQRYAEVFEMVSALFPASATAQAAALSIYLKQPTEFALLQTAMAVVEESDLQRLTVLHRNLGVELQVTAELVATLLTEIKTLYVNFLNATGSLSIEEIEQAWHRYQLNKEEDVPRGFLEVQLLLALQKS